MNEEISEGFKIIGEFLKEQLIKLWGWYQSTPMDTWLPITVIAIISGGLLIAWMNHKFDVQEGNFRNKIMNFIGVIIVFVLLILLYIWLVERGVIPQFF